MEREAERCQHSDWERCLFPCRDCPAPPTPPGTTVTVRGRGATVDGFVNGDWLPLSWWEYSDGLREDIADR